MRNDMDHGELPVHSDEARNSTRRSLLGAAGGFALAASGLLLPNWLAEEAEADGNPVRRIQQRKDQRRRQARHHRRRSKGHTKGKNKGKCVLCIRGIEWRVTIGSGLSCDVQLWSRAGGGRGWQLVDSQSYGFDTKEFYTNDTFGILWISQRYYLLATNDFPFPWVKIGYGGHFGSSGWVDGTLVTDRYTMHEGDFAPTMHVDNLAFQVYRGDDGEDDYKHFNLSISGG
jgi:hypothetical protein